MHTALFDHSKRISTFLDLADVCQLSQCCQQGRISFGSGARRVALIRGGGMPRRLRSKFWAFCLRVEETKEMTCGEQVGSSIGYYESLLEKATTTGKSGSGTAVLSFTGVQGEILRDVCRTFPGHVFFKRRDGPGENMLSNVLRACAFRYPDVGYCQGMNFVAGAFLLTRLSEEPNLFEELSEDDCRSDSFLSSGSTSRECSPDTRASKWERLAIHERIEEDVYWLMAALLTRHRGEIRIGNNSGPKGADELCLRELWLPGVPEMKLRVYQFDGLLKRELPRLHAHFRSTSLQLEVLVSQWLLTLFAYSLPMSSLVRAWDLLFMDGWKAVFRLGIARLKAVQDQLVSMEIEEMSRFLRGFRSSSSLQARFPPEQLLREAASIKVTRTILKQLQQDFAVRLLREHLGGGDGEWLLRYAPKRSSDPNVNLHFDSSTDLSFGVEAAVKGMLLDEMTYSRLREEIEAVSGPMAGDVAVFQCKIAAAAIRQDEARQQCMVLAPEVEQLQIEIDELQERAHLLSNQMHSLLLAPPCCQCANEECRRGPYSEDPTPKSDRIGILGVGSNLMNLASLVILPLRRLQLAPTYFSAGQRNSGLNNGQEGPLCTHCEMERSDMQLYKIKLDEVSGALAQREYRRARRKMKYEAALGQAEDAEHLKAVLSAQMLQLMQDGEAKVEGQLRAYAIRAQGGLPGCAPIFQVGTD